MPGKHTDKQGRQAEHVKESEQAKGMPAKQAESVAWATVAKQAGKVQKGKPGKKK